MSYFNIRNNELDIALTLKEKYYFIDGFSGVGKSLYVETILSYIDTPQEECIDTDLKYLVIQSKNELQLINENMSYNLVIVDETLAHNVIMKTLSLNCYVIAVTRKIYRDLNFSLNSLLIAIKCDDNITRVKSKYNITDYILIGKNIDCILTEDENAGYKFINNYFSKDYIVEPAKGKSNIKSFLSVSRNNVLIFADCDGIGSDINAIVKAINKRLKRGYKTYLCLPECFEHILLCSKFIGYDRDIYKIFSIEYNNTESFCEILLEYATKNKPYYFNHEQQELTDCWLIECSNCKNKEICEYLIEGNKLDSILKNGPCPELLMLTQKKNQFSALITACRD